MSQIRPVYGGEDKRAAQDLAEFLNSGKRKRPERYADLVPIIQDLNNLATGRAIGYNNFLDQEEKTRFKKTFGSENNYSLVVQGKDGSLRIFVSDPKYVPELAVKRLNTRLEKYSYLAEVAFRKGKLNVNWRTTGTSGSLVHEVLELAERGLLVRVRLCERCGDWFYAKQNRTRFCTKTCAKLHWQSSETAKAKRRKYIRKYMRKYRKKQAK
jgi:hypothetical protein